MQAVWREMGRTGLFGGGGAEVLLVDAVVFTAGFNGGQGFIEGVAQFGVVLAQGDAVVFGFEVGHF